MKSRSGMTGRSAVTGRGAMAGRSAKKKGLREDRLEKARATTDEQKKLEAKRKEKLLKKRGPSIVVLGAVKKQSKPTVLTILFAALMATLLGTGFSCMLTTTYDLKVYYIAFVPILAVLSLGMAYCHASESKTTPIVLAAFLAILSFGIVMFDLLHVGVQAGYAYSIMQKHAFHSLRPFFTTVEEFDKHKTSVTLLFLLISQIPAFFTTFVIVRRKNILLSLVWYLPYLFCSTIIVFKLPDAWPCVLAISGVLILLIFQSVRMLGDETVDVRMLKIAVPVVLLCGMLYMFFPTSGYDKDKLADTGFTQIQGLMKQVGNTLGIGDSTPKESEDALAQEKERGYKGCIIANPDERSAPDVSPGFEDLTKIGYFDPPDVKLLSVTRYYNDTETHVVTLTGRMIYLRCAAMEQMLGNSWKTAYYGELKPEEKYLTGASEIPLREADYVLQLHPYMELPIYLVPEYTDYMYLTSESRYADMEIEVRRIWNISECIPNYGDDTYEYAYNMIPQKTEAEWDPKYLEEEVYGTCLEVPEETRNSILESGVLPKWYLEVMDGTREMSTAEKVGTVVEYVRNLRPYNVETPYPPQDMDFVTWFMTKAPSGFCVHYSTTAAVLLRILGVPTRYCNGYLASIDPYGTKGEVSMKNAHSWIEFFDPDYGWVVDDPTPGNAMTASYYNAFAITGEYGDMDYDRGLSPTPKPKKKRMTPTPTPEPSDSDAPAAIAAARKVTRNPVAMPVLSILLAFVAVRLAYVFFWKRKFNSEDTNAAAIGYGKYFSLHLFILAATGSRVADSIVKKAEYSDSTITEEELLKLVRFGEHNLKKQKEGRARSARFLSWLLRVKLPHSAKKKRETEDPDT